MPATKKQWSRFTTVDNNINATVDEGWVLMEPLYSHYFAPKPAISQQLGSAKRETRVLKKKRTFPDNTRLRPATEYPLPQRPATSYHTEPLQTKTTKTTKTATTPIPMYAFPSNPTASKHSVLLPSLRTDTLWLNRPTQPLCIRKTPQSPQSPPPWTRGLGSPSSSHVVSNSPILPIGGKPHISRPSPPRMSARYIAPHAKEKVQMSSGASTSTATLLPSLQLGLESLLDSVESDSKKGRRASRPLSIATSHSAYSQSSGSYSVLYETRVGPGDSLDETRSALLRTGKEGVAEDAFSIRSVETIQIPVSQHPSVDSDNVIYFNVDPRLSTSTSTHTTISTLTTLVDVSPPQQEKKQLKCTKLSLQPCPSLASANRILSMNDLPPDHDALDLIINENTYQRYGYESYEHEGHQKKVDSPFSDDICADYDYIHAIDVLIYGTRPLPDVPVDVGRRPSRSTRPRPRENGSVRRRPSDSKRAAPTMTKRHNAGPPVSINRKPRNNGFGMGANAKNSLNMESRNDLATRDDRRSIFFQVTHFFGKSS